MSFEEPSKSQRKRDSHALQDLGEELVALSPEHLDGLDLPERLVDAIAEARRTTKHGARRRQMQFVGKLMRHIDPEPVRERIAALKAPSHAEVARLHLIEDWRDRLLAEADAITAFLNAYPHADAQQLRQLVRAVAEERARGKPPRAFRQLFHAIRDAVNAQNRSSTADTESTEKTE